MKFSVLMTTYYKETPNNLNISLKSITDDQTVLPDQIVLVLDGLVGNELEQIITRYVDKYPNIIFVHRLPSNVGQGRASAEGIKYCKHDYIARMDSDDISISNRFEMQILKFESNPNLSVVAGYIGEFEDDPTKIKFVRNVPETHDKICKMFRFRNPINNVSVMFKKKALERAGGYQNERANEDFSVYVRMLMTGSEFYNIPMILVKVRVGKDMLKRRGDINIFFAWCKNQKVLLLGKKTNIFLFISSCFGCLLFIGIHPNFKQFLYNKVLRKQYV